MLTTSDRGIVALMVHEGIVPGPYLDSVNVWTYGVGHTAAAGPPVPADMPRGMPDDLDAELRRVFDVFRADVPKYEAEVRRAIKVPVSQAEFDAAVSFHYNTGGIARATWVRHLNAGNRAEAAKAMMAWNKPKEVIKRREAERDLFLHGTYADGTIPVWGVTAKGTVIWRPVKRLTGSEALALLRAPASKPGVVAGPQPAPMPAPPPVGTGQWQPAAPVPPDPPALGTLAWLFSVIFGGFRR
jgi:lysozyme